jgi:hypothetical protein
MTTTHSPLRVLKAQADKIAKALKAAERGEEIVADPSGKIATALRDKYSVSFAVALTNVPVDLCARCGMLIGILRAAILQL